MKSAYSVSQDEILSILTILRECVALVQECHHEKKCSSNRVVIEILRNNLERLSQLITELTDYDRLKNGRIKFMTARYSLNRLARQVACDQLRIKALPRIHLELSYDKPAPEAVFDWEWMKKAVLILLRRLKFEYGPSASFGLSAKVTSKGNALLIHVYKSSGGFKKSEALPPFLILEVFIARTIVEKLKGRIRSFRLNPKQLIVAVEFAFLKPRKGLIKS